MGWGLRETYGIMRKKGDKQMSHLRQALHMPLTLPVMQRPRTGRKPAATGEGRAEKGTGRGARRLALCGPGSLSSLSGRLGPLGPGRASTLRVAQNERSKLRPGAEFPGLAGDEQRLPPSRSPDLRPAPRRRTWDRWTTAPHSRPAAPALGGRGAPAWLGAPTSGATDAPRLPARPPARLPVHPLARPRPLASLT